MRRMICSSTRHGDAILKRLPGEGPVLGVEVGSCRGVLADYLLRECPRLRLSMVDHWMALDAGDRRRSWSDANGEPCARRTEEEVHDDYVAAMAVAERYGDRADICRCDSVLASELFDDKSLDFVFVDAAHDYQSVFSDIIAWRHKVKPGGWIGGHDYGTPGIGNDVCKAVDEWSSSAGLTVEHDQFFTWFARIPEFK